MIKITDIALPLFVNSIKDQIFFLLFSERSHISGIEEADFQTNICILYKIIHLYAKILTHFHIFVNIYYTISKQMKCTISGFVLKEICKCVR